MAGLLDMIYGNADQTQAMGLLGAAMMQGRLPEGLLAAQQHMAGAKERQMKGLLAEMQIDELRARTDERKTEAAAKRAEMERQASIRQNMPNLFTQPGWAGGEAVPQSVGGIPMFSQPLSAAPMRQTPGGFDLNRALRLGMNPKEIAEAAGLMNIGRPEVARTVETVQNGRPVTLQYDKFGNPVGSPAPKWLDPKFERLGNRVGVLDPITGEERSSIGIGVSPDTIHQGTVTMRGQNMTDARARELNAITREANASQIINDPILGPLVVNKGTAASRPVTGADGKPVLGEKTVQAQKGANDVLMLLDQAEKIIPNATGSYAGAGYDQAARLFGASPEGAKATAQLKALEGAIMAKMPRMEGPQSNLDVQLYRQSAGMIGDPTIPNDQKLAAIQTIRSIQGRYAGQAPAQPAKPGALGSGSWGIQRVN